MRAGVHTETEITSSRENLLRRGALKLDFEMNDEGFLNI